MNASSIFSYCFSRALLYSKSLTLFVLINFVNWKLICIFFPISILPCFGTGSTLLTANYMTEDAVLIYMTACLSNV